MFLASLVCLLWLSSIDHIPLVTSGEHVHMREPIVCAQSTFRFHFKLIQQFLMAQIYFKDSLQLCDWCEGGLCLHYWFENVSDKSYLALSCCR